MNGFSDMMSKTEGRKNSLDCSILKDGEWPNRYIYMYG